jgi:uncharacterized protein YgiM (DUF1202 family)
LEILDKSKVRRRHDDCSARLQPLPGETTMLRSTKRMMGTVAVALSLLIGSASAESVRLNTDARLRARPGERAPTITKLDEGQVVRVVGRQGRWLKVSVGGRSGWVTRTQVDAEEQPAVAARDVPSRARKSSGVKARKGWSNLDEDATGDEAVEDDEEELDEALDEEKPKARPKKKPVKVAKVKKAKPSRRKAADGDLRVGMMVVVKSEATVRQRPSGKADEIYTAEKGEEMKVILVADDGGKWVRVQDGDGTKGWIETRAVASPHDWSGDEDDSDEGEDDESAIAADDDEGDEDGDDDGETRVRRRAKKGGLWYSVGANLAFVSKKQEFSSDSMSLVGQYALTNNSPAVLVGGFIGKQFGKYDLAAEAWYMRTVGGSGISIEDPNAAMGVMAETLDWTEQAIDVRAVAGYHMDKYTIIGRGGYHINNTVVATSDVAKLSSETLKGFTVGVGIEAPKLSDKIGARVSVEMLLSGTLEQTENLKDGDSAEVAGYYVNALATYRVSPKLEGLATYNLAYEGYAFSGASQRETAATNGKRTDLQHVVGVGVRYQF